MDDAMLAEVAGIARERKYSARETVFVEGDECAGFFYLLEGAVKLYKLSADGKEHVLHLVWPGETFAEAALFLGGSYPAYCEAIRATTVLLFPKDGFLDLLRRNPETSLRLLGAMALWLRRLVSQVEVLALRGSASRLASYLVEHAEEGKAVFQAPKATVASHLGMTPETLSRLFFKLEGLGIISVEGRTIHINNPQMLEEIAEGGDDL